MRWQRAFSLAAAALTCLGADPKLGQLKPVPRMQAVPQPYDQVSFQRDGIEIARYHFSPALNRPFLFPIVGPSGRTLTRMGHPGDPDTHRHHYSVWIGFGKVSGVDFWADHGRQERGRIVHQRIEQLDDGDEAASAVSEAVWAAGGGKVLLRERRQTFVHALPGKEWLLVIDLRLDAASEPVTFAQGQLGPIGVRMAKTIGVHHGSGLIRNSEGGENEEGVFRKPARWVDYSGQVASGILEGIALFDHPNNPKHPAMFHVRDDGWMGALLTHDAAVTVTPGKPLSLRYGLYVHTRLASRAAIDAQWKQFATAPLRPPFGPPRTEKDCMHGDHRRYNMPRSFQSYADCLSFVKGMP